MKGIGWERKPLRNIPVNYPSLQQHRRDLVSEHLSHSLCVENSHMQALFLEWLFFLPNVSISHTFYVPFLNSLGKQYTLGNGLAKWVFCEWQPQTWMWTASLPRGCFSNGLTCHSHFHPLPSLVQKNSGSSSGVGSRPVLAHCSTLCLGLSWQQGSSHLGQHRIGVEFSPESLGLLHNPHICSDFNSSPKADSPPPWLCQDF